MKMKAKVIDVVSNLGLNGGLRDCVDSGLGHGSKLNSFRLLSYFGGPFGAADIVSSELE